MMKNNLFRKIIFVLFAICLAQGVFAAKIETVNIKSAAMNKDIITMIVSPNKPKNGGAVIYLLHGYGGDAKSWSIIQPDIAKIADEFNVIFVCPDGKNNWYIDSPIDPSSQYETFIAKELTKYVDGKYKTKADASARAISGFSMGGYGALRIAFRNSDIFGTAGSASGAVDIINISSIPMDASPNKDFNLSAVLGKKESNLKRWKEYNLMDAIDKMKIPKLAVIIDCGIEDALVFGANNKFHNKLLKLNISHDYIVRPGGHTVPYWANSIEYQILFFLRFFDKKV